MKKLRKLYRKIQDKKNFWWESFSIRFKYSLGKLFFGRELKKGNPQLRTLGVEMLSGNKKSLNITLPPDYNALVDRIYADALSRMSKTENCVLGSADKKISDRLASSKNLPQITWDIPEIKDHTVSKMRLKKTLDLDGLQELCSAILPQVESVVYHSPIIVEKATVYRHSESTLPEYASILWHSDNHPEGVLKIMIYFTNVGSTDAPFEYLRHKTTGAVIHVKPGMPQKYPQGRVPQDVIEKYKKDGFEAFKVLGPARSIMIFDDKIIHKGNYAEKGFRDVLVLQLKPVMKRHERYIDPRWTSSV